MEYVLGLDVGSSSTKAGVCTLQGDLVALTSRNYPTEEPQPGFKEQNPELWWEAAVSAIREVVAKIDVHHLVAVGCTGHTCSHTFLDESGNILRPSLAFQDLRAAAQVEELDARIARTDMAAELGVDLPPAACWPLPRLLWMSKNEPGILDRARYVIQAKDFVNFRLTGSLSSDSGSNRGLVNLDTGIAAEKLLKKLGLPEHLVPPILKPEQVIGRISERTAYKTGLPLGLPVVTGWNDLNAGVLGCGAVEDGDTFNLTGTSDHIGIVTSTRYTAPELTCASYLPNKNLFYGVTSNGGGSLAWYQRSFGADIDTLLRVAEEIPAGSARLLFLPYLDGERAPIWDHCAAGAFIGIQSSHRQGHFVRSIMEGVSFSLLQILDVIEKYVGKIAGPIILSGGAARARLWNQIKTDVWGRATTVPEIVHPGVLGAAILAAVAAERYSNCQAAAGEMCRIKDRFEVVLERHKSYQRLYTHYCHLYPALRIHFRQIYEERLREEGQ